MAKKPQSPPDAPPDSGDKTEALIRRAQQGDNSAKAELWLRYRRLMCAIAYDATNIAPLVGGVTPSDEAGEVAIILFRTDALASIKSRDHFRNWLRRVLRNRAHDRRRSHELPLIDIPGDLADERVPDLVLEELREFLEGLPASLYAAAMAFMEEGSEQRAAEALGITRHAVRVRLSEIRELWVRRAGEE